MARKLILDKIKNYQERFPSDRESALEIYQFISNTSDAFERTNLKGHVTGSCLVVSPDLEKILLTHHKKLNKWIQLGGHSDGEENTLEVAMREAQEESGIRELSFLDKEIFSIDIHTIPARPSEPEHLHYDISFLIKAQHEKYKVSNESHDLQWFSLQELFDSKLETSLEKMVHRYSERKEKL